MRRKTYSYLKNDGYERNKERELKKGSLNLKIINKNKNNSTQLKSNQTKIKIK